MAIYRPDALYVPGVEERDLKKVIQSLQLLAARSMRVGTVINASLIPADAVSLVTMTFKTVTSFLLPAGNWVIAGMIGFRPAAMTNVTVLNGDFSLVDNTANFSNGNFVQESAPTTSGTVYGNDVVLAMPTVFYSFDVETPVYLVADANFTISTCKAFGTMVATCVG